MNSRRRHPITRARFAALQANLVTLTAILAVSCAPSRETQLASGRHNNLGVALMDHGHYEDAAKEFEAALAVDASSATARVNLGIAHYYAGRQDDAGAAFEEALARDPQNIRAHYMLGLMHQYHTARHERASEHFAAVAQADPADPWTQFYLGLSLARGQRHDQAAAALERAVGIEPGNQAALYQLSLALRAAGRDGDADRALGRFKDLRASLPGASAPGVGYMEQGRYAEAEATSSMGETAPRFEPWGSPDPETRTAAFKLALAPMSIAGDIDNDGIEERLEVVEGGVVLLRGEGAGATAGSGLETAGPGIAAAAFADVDHDGDLDVFFARDPGPDLLFRNDGTGRFLEIAQQAGVAGGSDARAGARSIARSSAVVFGDFDGDRAIDFCVTRRGGPPALYVNDRDGTFSEQSAGSGLSAAPAASGLSAGDVNHDGWTDLLLVPEAGGAPRLYLGRRGRRFEPGPSLPFPRDVTAAARCALHDADRDGDLDVVCADRSTSEVALLRNLAVAADAAPPATAAHWLTVTPRGLIRPQVLSNFSGVGAKVEVRAAGLWLVRELRSATGGMPEEGLTFGLGGVDRLDYVRAIFPSGVRITKRDVPVDQAIVLEEPAGKFTSCPMIYAWDGGRFRFVNDMLGFAVLGEWEPPGRWMRPDPDEWVAIDGALLGPRDGRYDIRFVNQLEEISFTDVMRLAAVDHDPDVEVHPHEPDRSTDPAAPPKLRAVRGARPPLTAVDDEGRSVLDALARADGRHVDDFELMPWRGFAREHDLVLDLGPFERTSPVLVMHGWTDWGSSSSLRAAFQAGVTPRPLSLEVPDGRGGWRTAIEDIGLPAGLPRTIVVPLAGHLAGRDHRVRIRTNLIVYWDRINVGYEDPDAPLDVAELELQSADLRRIGYPRRISPSAEPRRAEPIAWDYDDRDPLSEWGRMRGAYTRFGDVRRMLASRDDLLVVMNHGEEIALTFDAAALPPVAPGRVRDFLFYAWGYGKDMDINSATPGTVGPMPFRAMPGYPPDPAPIDPELLEFNTRSR